MPMKECFGVNLFTLISQYCKLQLIGVSYIPYIILLCVAWETPETPIPLITFWNFSHPPDLIRTPRLSIFVNHDQVTWPNVASGDFQNHGEGFATQQNTEFGLFSSEKLCIFWRISEKRNIIGHGNFVFWRMEYWKVLFSWVLIIPNPI